MQTGALSIKTVALAALLTSGCQERVVLQLRGTHGTEALVADFAGLQDSAHMRLLVVEGREKGMWSWLQRMREDWNQSTFVLAIACGRGSISKSDVPDECSARLLLASPEGSLVWQGMAGSVSVDVEEDASKVSLSIDFEPLTLSTFPPMKRRLLEVNGLRVMKTTEVLSRLEITPEVDPRRRSD